MQLARSNSATPFCKLCFDEPRTYDAISVLEGHPICSQCFHQMGPKFISSRIAGVKASSLFVYNSKVKEMLYQFKGCFDIELAPLFLTRQKSFLKHKYKGWVLVPAPSYSEKNEIRGFNHVGEMFKSLELPFIYPIRKIDCVKQADLNYEERQRIGEHIAWNEGVSVSGLKTLFVDDLLTTGATAKACVKLLKDKGAKKVEVLVMARTTDPSKRVNKYD